MDFTLTSAAKPKTSNHVDITRGFDSRQAVAAARTQDFKPAFDPRQLRIAQYWAQVVLKGLSDQSKLLDRVKPKLDLLSKEDSDYLLSSAYSKINKAIESGDFHVLRTLKTLEKAVLARDLKQKAFVSGGFALNILF